MPAIHPARLKTQVDALLARFAEPEVFLRDLHALLEFYADRTRHPGRVGKPRPLIQSHNAPRQVLRRIEAGLSPRVQADPEGARALADALWADSWFESRWLAAGILGELPLAHSAAVLARLQAWGQSCKDDALLDALLARGASRLRREAPDALLQQVEDWFAMDSLPARKLGLRAVPGLAASPEFENLPALYQMLSPALMGAEPDLQSDLLAAVRALGERSPRETVYFLQRMLQAPHQAALETLIRRSLDVFPPELAETLRTDLRQRARRR